MATSDTSALVRLYLTSGMMRLEPGKRWDILEALVQRTEDAADHNLPLLLWYASEPLATVDPARALQMMEDSNIPNLATFMIRRVGEINTTKAKKALEVL